MNFDQIVEKIRTERNLRDEVPSFDPSNGNEQAKILFLLEAPGPKAVQSGVISIDNNDPTAARMKSQLLEANFCKSDIAIWNIVPWYIGKRSEVKTIRAAVSSDIAEGNEYLPLVISAMFELQCVVLVGGAARKAHVVL